MGAGKSTVGALLARALDWAFIDLDDRIEATSKRTVAEIFRDHGEARFRALEHDAIVQLAGQDKLVLALGGGAVENPSTRALLMNSPEHCLVFLDAPLPELLQRCQLEGRVRPILADPQQVEARHRARLPHYRAAHLIIDTSGLAPLEVALQLRARLATDWQLEIPER